MRIERLYGRTGVIHGSGICIPFYQVNEKEWILLDCGTARMEQELFRTLEQEQVKVSAVIISHLHYDHAGNVRALKERFGTRVVMTAFDAGAARSPLTLKSIFYSSTTQEIQQYYAGMCCRADQIILPEQKDVVVEGVQFELLQLPGHAASQIGIVTPDQVAYLADSMFYGPMLSMDAIVYHLNWELTGRTADGLRSLSYPVCVLAHGGVFRDLCSLIEENRIYAEQLFEKFREVLPDDFTLQECIQCCEFSFGMSASSRMKAYMEERSIRSVLECFQERGEIKTQVKNGVIHYIK